MCTLNDYDFHQLLSYKILWHVIMHIDVGFQITGTPSTASPHLSEKYVSMFVKLSSVSVCVCAGHNADVEESWCARGLLFQLQP